MSKKIPNLTLICVDCVKYGEAIAALKKSLFQIEPERSIFFTDIKTYNPNFPFEIIKIDKIKSKEDYSRFIFKKLAAHITTDYVLIVHADGYVIDGEAWDERFLEYDLVGSPWLYTDGRNVGNGVSLRSKKLLDICASDDFMDVTHPEDAAICRLYRPYLEQKYGIKFAPEELADKFGYELREPTQSTFLFHGNFHPRFKPAVVIRRSGALGDCIATEPLLAYYHEKGYNVVVDMPVHLCMFFGNHNFSVKHISQLDERIPRTVIDLDGAYEENPKQLHLKSYYEKAGIEDGELRNPKLKFPIDAGNKLFKKYVVIHIDERSQPYRNAYGIFWPPIVNYLKDWGYDVFQVGQYEHEVVAGAIEMQTQTTSMLLYLIAGADLMISVDSGPAAMAVAMGVPSVIFFGSVEASYIHPDLSNVCVIEREGVCSTPKCWHDEIGGTTGKDCVVNKDMPPCVVFDSGTVLQKIESFLKEKGLVL